MVYNVCKVKSQEVTGAVVAAPNSMYYFWFLVFEISHPSACLVLFRNKTLI